MLNVYIEQITPELTWRLRQQVLYPSGTIFGMAAPGDEAGIHYGAFFENKLAGIISSFPNGTNCQLSKLAVTPALQRQGIGTQLIQYVNARAIEGGITRLWCNAEIRTTRFYRHAGFKPCGGMFNNGGMNYIPMEKCL